jgi:hypothetical protein
MRKVTVKEHRVQLSELEGGKVARESLETHQTRRTSTYTPNKIGGMSLFVISMEREPSCLALFGFTVVTPSLLTLVIITCHRSVGENSVDTVKNGSAFLHGLLQFPDR